MTGEGGGAAVGCGNNIRVRTLRNEQARAWRLEEGMVREEDNSSQRRGLLILKGVCRVWLLRRCPRLSVCKGASSWACYVCACENL